jgi:hypothetical protein
VRRPVWPSIVVAVLFLAIAATARAGDETCFPIEVTWYSPSGVAGCTLDGPTDGVASVYGGAAAAANWCVFPWTDCGYVRVQSHQTGLTITVPVAMYCDCWWTSDRRLVDLTFDQVAALGLNPEAGLFDVTVTPIDPASAGGGLGGEPVAGLPPVIPPAPLLPDTAVTQ